MLASLIIALTLQAAPPKDGFLGIRTFRCDFTEAGGRSYPDDGGEPTSTGRDQLKDVVLDAIDYRANTARLVGNAGADTVRVIRGDRSSSFLQVSTSGDPILVTVFRTPRSRAAQLADSYHAVISRHVALSAGGSRAVQVYGACKPLR